MTHALKAARAVADIPCDMIISDEQVRRAVEYLRTSDEYRGPRMQLHEAAPAELVERVVSILEDVPDLRDDRIAEARALLAHELPGADEVAAKLIGRLVSDAVR